VKSGEERHLTGEGRLRLWGLRVGGVRTQRSWVGNTRGGTRKVKPLPRGVGAFDYKKKTAGQRHNAGHKGGLKLGGRVDKPGGKSLRRGKNSKGGGGPK